MTEITLTTNEKTTQIVISGHSSTKRVNDIDLCCCSVSTLAFTLLKTLEKLKLQNLRYTFFKGYCAMSFEKDEENAFKALAAIDTVMNGFALLKESYPQNIKITTKGMVSI